MILILVHCIPVIDSSSNAVRHVLGIPRRFLADFQCTTMIVDDSGHVGPYTSLQLNASGYPVISYYDEYNKDLKLARCNNAACSSREIKTLDYSGDVGSYTLLQLNVNGYPVISYYDYSNKDLKLAICSDKACSSPDIKTLDYSGDVGSYTSLQKNVNGYPVISYFDATYGDLKLAKCNNHYRSIRWIILVLLDCTHHFS